MITGNHLCWSLFNPFSSYCFVKFSFFLFLRVLFFEGRDKLKNILCPFISIFGSRHWEFFCKTAVRRDITKIVIFFTKLDFVFSYSIRKFTILLKMKSDSTGIFLGLWSKCPSCNSTKQLFFLHSYEWLLPIIYLISVIKKLGRWKIKWLTILQRKN